MPDNQESPSKKRLNKTESIILHLPHDTNEKITLETREDVEEYIKDTSGVIAYLDKKSRRQQAINLKAIIFWLMTAIDGKE